MRQRVRRIPAARWWLLLAAAALLVIVSEHLASPVRDWAGDHQISVAVITESLLIAAVSLVVDRAAKRREERRSEAIATYALVEIRAAATRVRRAVSVPALVIQREAGGRSLSRRREDMAEAIPAALDREARVRAGEGAKRAYSIHRDLQEAVQRLRAEYRAWAPGLAGHSTLDSFLSEVPPIIRRAEELLAVVGSALELTRRLEDIDVPPPMRREKAPEAYFEYLDVVEPFEARVATYLLGEPRIVDAS